MARKLVAEEVARLMSARHQLQAGLAPWALLSVAAAGAFLRRHGR